MTEDIFKCSTHDYNTDSIVDWRIHLANESHITKGSAPCNQCGEVCEFSFNGKLKTDKAPALCVDCKTSLLGEMV